MHISRYAGAVWVVAVLVSGLVAFTGNGIAYADENERHERDVYRDERNNHERRESEEHRNKRDDHERSERNGRRGQGAAGFPENATYRQECSSCHVLYHPGLLPARSWAAIVGGSSKHFGENLSLDDKTAAELQAYFNANSAEHSHEKFSRKILGSIGHSSTPGRITEVPYIQREHRKVGKAVFARPSIKSFSNCGACHPDAGNGDFEEDNVSIPK